jgi:hypothetical protein
MRFGTVGEYADATAWQSVAHLTFADMFWRSVQTCSVLLRTEAGGTPAFQSVAALRRTYVVQQGRDARVPVRAASRQTYVVQRGQVPVVNAMQNGQLYTFGGHKCIFLLEGLRH